MKLERHFLNWNTPVLPAAAKFLWDKFAVNGEFDLSPVVIVLPGKRAGRRLKEILVWQTEQHTASGSPVLFAPPRFTTPGQLSEILLGNQAFVASDLQTQLAWTAALRSLDATQLQTLFANPPQESDFLGWWPLAQELQALDSELAVQGVSCESLADYCRLISETEAARWTTLQEISHRAQRQLADAGLMARDQARRKALDTNQVPCNAKIVLISTVEINAVTRRLLERSNCEILALVHADPREADGFGEFGELRPEYWQEKTIGLRNEQIHIVNRPADQAAEVVEILQSLGERVRNDAITLGVGDEAAAPLMERIIEQGGRPVRRSVGTGLAQTAPVQLLRALSDFVSDPRAENFQALCLHPDFGDWLRQRPGVASSERCSAEVADRYFAAHLPLKIDEGSFALPVELQQVVTALNALLPMERAGHKPLSEWMPFLRDVLVQTYGGRDYGQAIPGEAELFQALEAVGNLLRSLEELGFAPGVVPELSFAQTLRFVLQQAERASLPEAHEENAVELLGWLELHLDDAPILVITGFNEGLIPQTLVAAPFLTDSLRRKFGLQDEQRRYARDAYSLSAMTHSTRKLELVCGRYSAQNDHLHPSRLLFACDAEDALQRIRHFYEEGAEKPERLLPGLSHGDSNRLARIPRPRLLPAPPEKLSVTAFRDYLACPYRFYLKHICRLRVVGPIADEMEADVFGTLLHEVLRDFGNEARTNPQQGLLSEEEIGERVLALLNRIALRHFGREQMAAVELQLHQMERRLKKFAQVQAQQFADGWTILHVEHELTQSVEVDGMPFIIEGIADRVDYHAENDVYRILDYKTGDVKKTPENIHRIKPKDSEAQWVDLQLPLYRRIFGMPVTSVGYFCLPAELQSIGIEQAEWSREELAQADGVVDEVIRKVRNQIFWPPGEPPLYPDASAFAAICLDTHTKREQIIAGPGEGEVVWPLGHAQSPGRQA